MTRYLPSSFVSCLWYETESRSREYKRRTAILAIRSVNKGNIIEKEQYLYAEHSGYTRAGNIAPSCPFGWPITA